MKRTQDSPHKPLKRKIKPEPDELSDATGPKRRRAAAPKGKGKGKEEEEKPLLWPEYFDSLFKVFKALNTVLAFVSSRKHIATTFPVVRSSVEGLLKRPLDMSQVSELKALLPDLIKFAYIPANDLRVNDTSETTSSRSKEPDFSLAGPSHNSGNTEKEEHVLVLDFAENSKGKAGQNAQGNLFSMPPSLTPTALKKLVEKRNERFKHAIDELLLATPPDEDPVLLLQSAGRAHIPINPSSSSAFADPIMAIVPEPQNRPTIDAVIGEIMEQSWYKQQIVDRRTVDAKPGQIAELDTPLSESIKKALCDSRKITSLYTHQVAAINALAQGNHVIVSTSTASGKSVIYQVPVLTFLEADPDATAMFVYPTKALAQDQKAALEQLLCACPGLEHIKVATYDGDTPQDQRREIRESASVIFTNFDTIHAAILPHEDLWRRFLKNLKLVAVDELHYYRDLFGSHVALVIRRFRRVCAALGNRRTLFVSCSATISKPRQHMMNMFGIDDIVEVIEDGAPSGRKDVLVWDPPAVDPAVPTLGKESTISEATGLMSFLMKRGIRVILFCKYRKTCELAMKAMRTKLSSEGRTDILDRVMPYRGGYSQQDRRRIENEAFSGNLLGLIATNALELGVDIGVLDAVIMAGFPFGIANFRQQAGRAGRRARDALAVFVPDQLPIDQHYVQFPHDLFDKATDDLAVDLDSEIVVEAHLQCAGQEMPLSAEDEVYFGPLTRKLLETKLSKDKDGWYHPNAKYMPFPAGYVHLRGAEQDKYTVVDISHINKSDGGAKILEEIEVSRALFEIYEGGVFIHQGLTFIMKEVSHDTKIAKLIRADVNYITTPRDVDAKQTYRIREIKDSSEHAFYGRVDVTTKVYGFYKVRNNAILDVVDVETPPWEHDTTGFWIDVPKAILQLMMDKNISPAEAIHSAQHAFLNVFSMGTDLRTECKAAEKEYKASESQRKRPGRLIFYDPIGKDGGVAAKAFDHVTEFLNKAQNTIEECPCDAGCPDCIHSVSCKEGNQVHSKIGAQLILRGILGLPIEAGCILPVEAHHGFNTVIEAPSVRAVQGVQVETV
ncbi:hypothetical protein PLICRDRAFT_175191 [Plicaturopsis crispa FD-325 SS-3]|nr:hypothetical protein PLICRDRAFT_175191 [Plicaturopsis crispa FD-325 SS-3]